MKETPSKVGHFSEIAETFSTTAKNFQYLVQIFALHTYKHDMSEYKGWSTS